METQPHPQALHSVHLMGKHVEIDLDSKETESRKDTYESRELQEIPMESDGNPYKRKRPESKNLCQNLSQNSLIQKSITASRKEEEEQYRESRPTGNFGDRIRDRRAQSPLYCN